MKNLLLQIFTWWNGATMGTSFYTARNGERVGKDDAGNVYYRNADDSKRWVIYAGEADPSAIPPGWHGWIHKRTDLAPSSDDYIPREWELAHRANPTGTAQAYRPKGSILTPERRPEVTGDYEAWTP